MSATHTRPSPVPRRAARTAWQATAGTEPGRRPRETRVENRREHLRDRLPDQPAPGRRGGTPGNRSPPPGFGDHHPAITATSTSNTDSSVSPDVRPFPAPHLTPAGTTTSDGFCPVSPRLTAGAAGAATPQHNRHPGRPPPDKNDHFPPAPAAFT